MSRKSVSRRLAVGSFAICLALPASLAAHGDLHGQIADVTQRIERDPVNAELYLKRGHLHRVHREWEPALADYEHAARLSPGLPAADLGRGVTLLEAGRPEAAKVFLDRFLTTHPDHPDARVARARALLGLGQRLAAVEDLTHAIERLSRPRPEHYLDRARALAAEGDAHVDEALRGLDQGLERLGPVVTLQLLAIDLELRRERYEAALARLDRITPQGSRREAWLVRRGEILIQAGRSREAREAFRAALVEIKALPGPRRNTRATEELERRARAGLDRVAVETPP